VGINKIISVRTYSVSGTARLPNKYLLSLLEYTGDTFKRILPDVFSLLCNIVNSRMFLCHFFPQERKRSMNSWYREKVRKVNIYLKSQSLGSRKATLSVREKVRLP
jgi:hypothetical protein